MQRLYIGNKDVSGALKLDDNFVYVPFPEPFEAEYLIVGGGGTGGVRETNYDGYGGGGAGGFVTGSSTILTDTSYTVSVGGSDTNSFIGTPLNITALAGGAGGKANSSGGAKTDGLEGASGGGAAVDSPISTDYGRGTAGQGNDGGNIISAGIGGAGGGGYSTAGFGFDGIANLGNGGVGIESSFDGTPTWYCVGGGSNTGSNGPNWGGPGCGGKGNTISVNGLSGVVVIKYKSPFLLASGGNSVYRIGDWMYHKFTSTGTFKTI